MYVCEQEAATWDFEWDIETPAEFLGMKVSKYLGDDNLSIL